MSQSRLNAFAVYLATFAGLGAGGAPTALGQIYSEWVNGGNALWSNGGNWSSGAVTNYGQLEFKGNGAATMDNDLGFALGQWRLYFDGSQSYTLGSSTGSVINLYDNSGAHAWILSDSAVTQTFSSTQLINFAAGAGDIFGQISARGAGDLVLGPIGITGSQVQQVRVAGTSTGKVIFNNTISGTGKEMVIGLDQAAVEQANTVAIYRANNTYTGGTFVVAGDLQLESGNGSAGNFYLGQVSGTSDAKLSLTDLDGGFTLAQAIEVRTGSSGVKTIASTNTSGTNSMTGGILLNNPLTVNTTAGGTLAVTTTGLSGNGALTKSGTGTLILSAAAPTRSTGATTVTAGVLSVRENTALGTNATANTIPVAVNSGATLEVNGSGLVLDNGLLTTLNSGATLRSVGSNTLNGRVLIPTTVAAHSVTISAVGATDVLTLGNGANDLSGGNGTDDLITVGGLGTVAAANASDYVGNWAVSSGTLQLGATGALGTGAQVVALNGGNLSGAMAANTTFTGPAAAGVTLTANANIISDRSTVGAGVTYTYGPLTLAGQTITALRGANATSGVGGSTFGNVTVTGGTPTFAAGANALLTLGNITGTNTNLIFDGAGSSAVTGIIGTGTGNLTKTGAGTVTLGGVNTFSGGINANGGLVAFSANANLGADVPINFNGGGISFTAAGTFTPVAARTLNIGAGGGTLDVVTAGSAGKILLNVANLLNGTGTVTKTGPGTLQLIAANATLSGPWAVSGGFIEAQNVGALGSGAVTVNAGGEVVASNLSLANSITLNGGTISANGGALLGNFIGPINVTANSTVAARLFQTQANTNTVTLSGALTGSGNLALTTGATVVPASPANVILRSDTSGYSGTMAIGNGVTLQPRLANLASPVAGASGINATYYNFGSNVGTASSAFATGLTLDRPQSSTRTETVIGIPQAGSNGDYPAVPVPHFGVTAAGASYNGTMWKGLINVTTAGAYQFSGTDDDAATLYIDGQPIGSLGVVSTNTNIGAAVNLTAGAHSIVYRHTNGTGGGYATLNYSGADTASAVVAVGSITGSLTTGALAPSAIPALSVTGVVATPSTIDLTLDNTSPTLAFATGTQLNVTSPTNSSLTITGATTLNGANVLNPTGGFITLAGAIGESAAASPPCSQASCGWMRLGAMPSRRAV
jgi:fibronectin-binding autotransporter adhesin